MAVFYKLYQIMKEGSADQGKWRVRVVPQGVVTTKELAKIMEQNCTVKSSDIKAVLRELAETMKTSLLDGNRVVLDGLGAFKVTLKCTGTEKKEDFKIGHNVKGLRLRFTPATETGADKKRVRMFLNGAKAKEILQNANHTGDKD